MLSRLNSSVKQSCLRGSIKLNGFASRLVYDTFSNCTLPDKEKLRLTLWQNPSLALVDYEAS